MYCNWHVLKRRKYLQHYFKPFRISNAPVADEVGNHKSASPSSLKSDFSVGKCRHHNEVGVLNEKMCNKYTIITIFYIIE